MAEDGVSDSYLVISEHKNNERKESNNSNSELLQLKLESAERENEELKRRRSEAAKANERVVGIFAAHEQRWFVERNKLRLQIGSLLNELKVVEMKRDESFYKFNEQLQSKDKKMKELEHKLIETETITNELRETAKREAKEHSAELWKHKTAFFELVSTQRQLEAELGRSVRQGEAAKQELDSVLAQKDKSVFMNQKLSLELVKFKQDLEQKDQILLAVLRKSKLDTTEKQMLLKEVKLSKTKAKQAELEGWVCSEAEKYAAAVKQMHHFEIDAFAEQLRLKDEKLEAFRWRLMSMELESKQLENELPLLKQDNMKLEALLLDQETEIHSLKMQLKPPNMYLNPPMQDQEAIIMTNESLWSKVKDITRRKAAHKEKETLIENQPKEIDLRVQSPEKEFKEEEVPLETFSSKEEGVGVSMAEVENAKKLESGSECSSKKMNSLWKMDIHALGVSYKIKRLKQQVVMFERVKGNQEIRCEDGQSDHSLMSLLNKQVARYSSVNGKTDDLCKRMHENESDMKCGDLGVEIRKRESKKLEHFLEETLQLQRYIVAAGQKLRELQSKIVGAAEQPFEGVAASFDMKRFADGLTTLFKDVQRGLEIRISRVIGDLEGTLACEGMMIHLQKK